MSRKKNVQTTANLTLVLDILREVTREDLGQEMCERIEAIRRLANETTCTDETFQKLEEAIASLTDKELLYVAQVFNQTLNLINTTEQLNSTETEVLKQNPIRFVALCQELREAGRSDAEIIKAIEELHMDLVLTAHPTEINRRSLINNLNETSECLLKLDSKELPEHYRRQLMHRLHQLIVQYWFTDEIRNRKPTPEEEAKWGNDVIEYSLWAAVPAFIRELNVQLSDMLKGYTLPLEARPIQFSAWMGGDRDGNPNVTACVTRTVLLMNRRRAAKLFLQDVEALVRELSMSVCTPELRAYLGDEEVAEPYREVMRRLRSKLRATYEYLNECVETGVFKEQPEGLVWTDEELWEPLKLCYDSLHACEMGVIADDRLIDTMRRVQCFGITLVKTDVRQESTRHTEAISEVVRYLGLGDYASWSEEEKQAFLIRELSSRRPLIPRDWTPSADTAEVLETCRLVAATPKGVIPVYLISMSQTPSDVLAVHLLLKECGCPYHMPVGPLFETLEDLKHAAGVMKQLFSIGWYRGIIGNKQMVMIGYSDSAKDAGALAAGWGQYTGQEELIKVCEEAGVTLTLFHGRGGTIGRGGGPAKTALFSQPPGSLRGGLRVTVQGEMIRFKFGQKGTALRTLDLYLEAILLANLLPPPTPKAEWREIMDELQASSCQLYQDVVRGNPDFISYFDQATPISELSKLPIGSRPAKRRAAPTVDSLRAIPWIFSWSQNRLMLPSWLGAGEALQQAIDAGKLPLLEEMYREWPFFRTRISMLEMVYAKSEAPIAEAYDQRLVAPEIRYLGEDMRRRLETDTQTILAISHDAVLMEDIDSDSNVAGSIALRNSFILPLNFLQIELLHRARSREASSSDVDQALMVTISGIAAGVRNSG